MTSQNETFGVVGGGLLGLTLSLRLAARGHRVTLLEAADHLGGLADAWQLGDVTWDRHYHVTLMSDSHLRTILKELNLDREMQWSQTKTGFICDGKLMSLSNSWEFLRFPPLGLIDKLRLAWTIWHASRIGNWQHLQQVPVEDWLVRHSGRRTFERIWLPLLKAKLGDAWKRTSAAFIWATIQRMYAARSAGMKHEMFGYLPGGYARMLEAFRGHLEKLGVEIRTGCRVHQIEREDDGRLVVATAADERFSFDRVVATTPATVAARICPQFSGEEIRGLQRIEYVGIVCASLLLRKPLSPYYVTNITDPAPFTGVIEMTALVDPTHLGGQSLVYLPKYVLEGDPTWSQTDEQIREQFLAGLAKFYPKFSAEDVLAFRLSRVRQVFALPSLDYGSHVPPMETSVPGLFLVNSAQIVNGTLNVNETVRLAESSIDLLCRPLSRSFQPGATTNVSPDRELVARP